MDNYTKFLEKQSLIFEMALDECIRQFDYSDSEQWRTDFKSVLLDIARSKYEENLGEKNANSKHQ